MTPTYPPNIYQLPYATRLDSTAGTGIRSTPTRESSAIGLATSEIRSATVSPTCFPILLYFFVGARFGSAVFASFSALVRLRNAKQRRLSRLPLFDGRSITYPEANRRRCHAVAREARPSDGTVHLDHGGTPKRLIVKHSSAPSRSAGTATSSPPRLRRRGFDTRSLRSDRLTRPACRPNTGLRRRASCPAGAAPRRSPLALRAPARPESPPVRPRQ